MRTRTPFVRRVLFAAAATLGLTAAQVAWADLQITTSKEYDGTGTCTLDTNQNNGRVCTNDEVRYNVAYQVTPPPASQSNVTITLTIPAGEPFKFSPGSPILAACRNAAAAISADGKTLSCQLRGLAPNPPAGPISTQSGDLKVDLLTTGAARNGSMLSQLQSRITSTQNPTGATANGPGVTVVARPQVDLYKKYVGLFADHPRPAGCTSTETTGVTLRFRVGLDIKQIKGHESLREGWQYTDDLSQISPNACIELVTNWNSQTTGGVWPTVASGNTTGLSAGGGGYTVNRATNTVTANTGTGATGAPLTSGEVTGVADGFNQVTALHELRIWVPLNEIRGGTATTPGTSCTYSGRNTITGFNPVGVSGQANNSDDPANNQDVFNGVDLCKGSYEKLFASNTKGNSVSLFNLPPRMSNELIGPNDYVDSYLLWANDGVDAVRQSHCDRWDNRKMVVDLLDPTIHKSGYAGPGYRYQTVLPSSPMVQDMSPAYAHIWGDSAGTRGPTGSGEIEFGYVGDGSFSDANLRSVSCNNGDSKLTGPGVPASGWITQSQLKLNPGLVSKINAVRMMDVVIPPGKKFQVFVHLHTLSTNPLTGAVWPDGTIIPNYGAYQVSTSATGNLPGTGNWAASARAAMGNDPLALLTSAGSSNCATAGRYCDDGYSDRLRLATETVGVRKGVLGTDLTGGPNSDNPSIPRFRGDFVTYQLWPTLTAKSPGVQINNDLILVDTLPPGTRFVPGSLTFGGVPVPATDYVLVDGSATFGASKLAIRIPNQLAEANPVARIPVVEFQAELMLADPNNTVSRQLVNSVEIQACMSGASLNANATYNCNVQTASQQLSERTSTRTISLAASGALVVQKAVVGSISQQIGSKFTMALNYLNAGSNMVPDHRLIDVLPRVGEADRGFPDLAADATAFSGVRRLLEVRTPLPTGYVVYYTTAAPASINVNPKCPSNWGVGNWPQFAPGVPPSAGSCPVAGTTTWVAANQSGAVWSGFPVGTTAILVKDLNAFASGAPMRSVQLDFDTPGSRDGDRYANNFSGAHGGPGTQLNTPGDPSSGNGPGATFDAYSNNVTVRVVAASLSGTVFEDPNRNGSAGFEPGVDTGLPGVVVTLTQGGLPIGTATTALADIPAGQFYNPATGGASATPGPGLCPVPATGLAMGQYLFCDLLAGSGYQVVETQPSGYTTTSNAAGTAGGAADAATDTTSGITLGVGQRATGYDFGESTATTVSGRVYVESNGNQVDDGPTIDPGLVTTVSISCVGPAGAPNYTNSMQTGADGTYSFSGMAPGAQCTITETQPTGHNNAYTQPGASGNPSTVGPVDPQGAGSTTDSKITITVPPAGSPNNNFAETKGSGGNVSSVPTLNQWSLLLLATLLSGLALRRRSRVS